MAANSLLLNAREPLVTPTYDGSGQCVHPDLIRVSGAVFGAEYLMAVEPYRFGDQSLENPSLLASNDGIDWFVPPGLVNPIVAAPASKAAWHSDADLLRIRDGGLAAYYRFNSGAGETNLLRIFSSDGVRWTPPEGLAVFPVSGRFASPALVDAGDQYLMFFVDTVAERLLVSESADGGKWSPARQLLAFPKAWHLDAYRQGELTYLLVNDKRALFLIRSLDLRAWEFLGPAGWLPANREGVAAQDAVPILNPSPGSWDDGLIYRSTFLVEDGMLRLWYGAHSKGGSWRVGYTSGPLPR